MKKFFLLAAIMLATSTVAQTSKWGFSYDAEFIKVKYDLSGYGFSAGEESVTAHTINLHYSFTDWSSPFQFGPLISARTLTAEGESATDFLVGVDFGYNFGGAALVLDSYYVFGNDLDPILLKPALEFGKRTAFVVGYTKYIYQNDMASELGIEASGPFVGLKYKF